MFKVSRDHDYPHSLRKRLNASAALLTFLELIHTQAFWLHETTVIIQPIFQYLVSTMIWEWSNRSMKNGRSLHHHGYMWVIFSITQSFFQKFFLQFEILLRGCQQERRSRSESNILYYGMLFKLFIQKNCAVNYYDGFFFQPVPSGLYKLLLWINKEYNNPPVIVTENGVSDNNGVNDRNRVNYFNSYLSAVLDAIVSYCFCFSKKNTISVHRTHRRSLLWNALNESLT